jgi:hypothetical protein
MGVIAPSQKTSATVTKKRSIDFSKLGPLKNQGTKGFSSYRDPAASSTRKGSKHVDAMDSDDEDDETRARDEMEDADPKDENGNPLVLTEEDRARQEEMAEGVRHIKVRSSSSLSPMNTTDMSTAQTSTFWRVQQPQQITSSRQLHLTHDRQLALT